MQEKSPDGGSDNDRFRMSERRRVIGHTSGKEDLTSEHVGARSSMALHTVVLVLVGLS
jgi:hypothetical protein